MALSGSINGTTSNSYIASKIVWEAKQSIEGNYSDVTAVLTYSRTNTGYTTDGTWSGGITINGVRTPYSQYISITYNSNTVAMSVSTRVYHDSDGTKKITIKADGGISGTSLTSTSLSQEITLNTIPRLSNPTLSVSSVAFGKTVTIYTNKKSSNFIHKLYYKFGNSGWYLIAENIVDSYTWTVPKTLMNQIPNSTSLALTIGCDTYSGGTMLGESFAPLTATVPTTDADTFPTVGDVVWTKTSGEPDGWGMVQNVSKGTLKITNSKGAYGSTIQKYSLSFAGLSSTTSSLEVSNIASSGNIKAEASVTDSRGQTSWADVYFEVDAYSTPQVSVDIYRCNSSGAEDTSGDYLRVLAKASVTSLSGKNSLQSLSIKLKKSSSTSYGTPITLTSGTAKIISASSNNSWDWEVVATDKVNTTTVSSSASTGEVVLDILYNGKGIGIGKVAEKEGLDSAWPFMLNGVDQTPIKPVDYVVEQVSTAYYTYRKWNSGVVECWGKWYAANYAINNAWGYLYESGVNSIDFPPNLFTGPPVINISVDYATGGILGLEMMGSTTKDKTCDFYVVRATPSTLDFQLSWFAVGRWK